MLRLRLKCTGLGQGKQVQRGIQGSGGVVSPEQGSRVVRWNRSQSQGAKMSRAYDLAEWK
jgi:hypothetical protein